MSKGAGHRDVRKGKTGGWILLAVLTLVNLVISILLRLSDRKRALTAIRQDDELRLLYSGEKTTKSL